MPIGDDFDDENDNEKEENQPEEDIGDDIGFIKTLDFSKGMSDQFLIYANEVIGYRAIPDIRDGLKPVHRRILYGMYVNDYKASDKPKKSAQIVGKVMGEYHPHGDASIYSAMVRMAQPFSMNIKYIEGSGNWGNRDGLSAAAMRYTECRMTNFSEESFFEAIKKDVVPFGGTYDGMHKEPLVLPIVIPTLLVNSLSGIAVGLATDILPHNLGEVVDCMIRYLDNQDISDDDLIGNLTPDFPTGCNLAYDKENMMKIYKTGQGRPVRVRGVYHVEDEKKIIFTEIPFQLSKKNLIEEIANHCDNKSIEGINDVWDESTGDVRLVIEINNRTNAEVVVAQLFKYTSLETTFKANFTVLINGVPTVVSIRRIMEEFVKFRIKCIKNELQFDLNQAEATLHIREGLKIVHDHLDRVIEIIRGSSGDEESRKKLMDEFKLSEKQADSILAMRLGNISKLQGRKVQDEINELQTKISDLKSFLADSARINQKIKDMALAIKDKYNIPRRTKMVGGFSDTDILDLIVEEEIVLLFTSDDKIKANRISDYKTQKRGGQGSFGANTQDGVFTKFIVRSNTRETLLIFTNKGNCFWLMAYKIPLTNKQNKPLNVHGLLNPLIDGGLEEGESVIACLSINEFDDKRNIMILSKAGLIKRLKLPWFERFRKRAYKIYPCKDLNIDVLSVKMAHSEADLMMFTKNGNALRFNISKIRESENRSAMGVRTMKLKGDDELLGFSTVQDDQFVMNITEKGYGKLTPAKEFSVKGTRTGSGVVYCKISEDVTGKCVLALPVYLSGDILVMTSNSKTVRVKVESIRICGRSARGVIIQKMMKGERVVAGAFIAELEEDEIRETQQSLDETHASIEIPSDIIENTSDIIENTSEESNDNTLSDDENPFIDTDDLGPKGEDNDGSDIIDNLGEDDNNETQE
ncbi:MAG: DNA gyrase subunit A [Planctomycetota bacterium]|nr:MAG: DNA gyrase subunit A [Planctomycetota bacterium]